MCIRDSLNCVHEFDEILGEYIEALPKNTTLILFSDHAPPFTGPSIKRNRFIGEKTPNEYFYATEMVPVFVFQKGNPNTEFKSSSVTNKEFIERGDARRIMEYVKDMNPRSLPLLNHPAHRDTLTKHPVPADGKLNLSGEFSILDLAQCCLLYTSPSPRDS